MKKIEKLENVFNELAKKYFNSIYNLGSLQYLVKLRNLVESDALSWLNLEKGNFDAGTLLDSELKKAEEINSKDPVEPGDVDGLFYACVLLTYSLESQKIAIEQPKVIRDLMGMYDKRVNTALFCLGLPETYNREDLDNAYKKHPREEISYYILAKNLKNRNATRGGESNKVDDVNVLSDNLQAKFGECLNNFKEDEIEERKTFILNSFKKELNISDVCTILDLRKSDIEVEGISSDEKEKLSKMILKKEIEVLEGISLISNDDIRSGELRNFIMACAFLSRYLKNKVGLEIKVPAKVKIKDKARENNPEENREDSTLSGPDNFVPTIKAARDYFGLPEDYTIDDLEQAYSDVPSEDMVGARYYNILKNNLANKEIKVKAIRKVKRNKMIKKVLFIGLGLVALSLTVVSLWNLVNLTNMVVNSVKWYNLASIAAKENLHNVSVKLAGRLLGMGAQFDSSSGYWFLSTLGKKMIASDMLAFTGKILAGSTIASFIGLHVGTHLSSYGKINRKIRKLEAEYSNMDREKFYSKLFYISALEKDTALSSEQRKEINMRLKDIQGAYISGESENRRRR